MSEQIVCETNGKMLCCGFFNAYCTYGEEKRAYFRFYTHIRTQNEPQLLCVSDIFIHSRRVGIANIVL